MSFSPITTGPLAPSLPVRGPGITTGPQGSPQLLPSVVQVVPNASVTRRDDGRDAFAIARADDIVSAPPQERQLMVAAAGDPIPILYGRDRIGPAVVRFLTANGAVVVLYVWGYGPYDGWEKLWINDIDVTAALPAGVTMQHFDGTQSAPSSILVSAYAANGKTWSNVLPNVVYTAARYDAGAGITGAPVVNMRWRGRKLFDPRTSLTVWSDNAGLALRDMLTASRTTSYGFGRTVTDADFSALANHCDALIGTPAEKRRTINYNFAERISSQQMLETLRTAASCFVVLDTFPVRVIVDADATAVRGFNRSQFRRVRVSRKSRYNRATVVQVNYTRINGDTYDRHFAEYARPGVSTGALPRIVTTVDMFWVNRYSQAYREAVERANKLWNDVSVEADVFDEALEVTHGDIVDLTDDDNGFASKKFRVVAVPNPSPSAFGLVLQEHDAANYSGVVQTAPSSDNTTLLDPRVTPTVGALTLTESIATTPNGAVPLSTINVAFASLVWPFLSGYRILVRDGTGAQVEEAIINSAPATTTWQSKPLPVYTTYTVEVRARGPGSESATASTDTITLLGAGLASLAEVYGLAITRAGLPGWFLDGVEAYQLYQGDSVLRLRTQAGAEPSMATVYSGGNMLTPGLQTMALDADRAVGTVYPESWSAFSPVFDMLTQRTAVYAVLNVARWTQLYFKRLRFTVRVSASAGMTPFVESDSPSALLTGRYAQVILRTFAVSSRRYFWAIEFDRARIQQMMPAVTDSISTTTLTTGGVEVRLPRRYITVSSIQATARASTNVAVSTSNLTISETNDDGNTVQVHAYDGAARVAVPVDLQITGVAAA